MSDHCTSHSPLRQQSKQGKPTVSYKFQSFITVAYENLNLPEIHPVANNMREHREKLN